MMKDFLKKAKAYAERKFKEVLTLENLKPALVLAVFFMLFMGRKAMAGTTGAEFQNIYTMLVDWTSGYLGKTIALGAFLAGMGIGIVRQSLMAVVSGIGGGLAVAYMPQVMNGIVTAQF
jgi:conjugal transfer pilus assembly protein TraA